MNSEEDANKLLLKYGESSKMILPVVTPIAIEFGNGLTPLIQGQDKVLNKKVEQSETQHSVRNHHLLTPGTVVRNPPDC